VVGGPARFLVAGLPVEPGFGFAQRSSLPRHRPVQGFFGLEFVLGGEGRMELAVPDHPVIVEIAVAVFVIDRVVDVQPAPSVDDKGLLGTTTGGDYWIPELKVSDMGTSG
jgi:hypothetical protein